MLEDIPGPVQITSWRAVIDNNYSLAQTPQHSKTS